MSELQAVANESFAMAAFSAMSLPPFFPLADALRKAAEKTARQYDRNAVEAARTYTETLVKSWGGL